MRSRSSRRAGRTLTGRERTFAHEYVKDHNGKRAAIAAGYSPRSAESIASRLLRKGKVAELISDLERKHLARIDMSAADVIRELSLVGRARLPDALNTDGTFKTLEELPEALRAGLSKLKTKEVRSKETGPDGQPLATGRVIEFEIGGKLEALKTLARHHGLVRDRVEVKHSLTLEQLLVMAARIREKKARERELAAARAKENAA